MIVSDGLVCDQCGGYIYIWFSGLTTPPRMCNCRKFNPEGHSTGLPVGWRCPVCGRVYAPWVASCGDPHIKTQTGNTSNWEAGDE